jgi:aminoglycoside phosphotransferase (APT) family kinase protein
VDELDAVGRQCAGLLRRPGLPGRRAGRLLDLVAEALEEATFSPPVLLHRDLHPQQLLLNGNAVGFVDLDDVAVGAPEIDLGNLLAHLDLFGLFHSRRSVPLAHSARMLESVYCSAHPLSRPALFVTRGASLLRLAGVYAGTTELAPLVPRLVDRAEDLLARGVAS